MSFKHLLLDIYTFGSLSKAKTNTYQLAARDEEWSAISMYIKNNDKFLDVGCGAGYSMRKAKQDFECDVYGVDPDPMGHGVGREGSNFDVGIENIQKGVSEKLPYKNKTFDVVYSSHVLEHVQDEEESLKEMKRVLKDKGVLIIGVPTSTMTSINWITQVLFTTHIKLFSIIFSKIINTGKYFWWELFIPVSHSFKNRSLLYDLKHYKINNWKKIIEKEFKIKQTILPALYPYPEYLQLFPLFKSKYLSSSVFFICTKK
jgi:ubiquinone/menaquinone biosynthesis C-methylase UbiE